MGDLVRDALHATGVDEEVEQAIADALIRSWTERPASKNNTPVTERKIRTSSTEPNFAKVRIVAEQLFRRLERIYDAKLQTWKQKEEKTVEEMIARLRHEYKENLLIKQRQMDELAERRDDEYRSKEDMLREDVRFTFEKKKLEYERAWREIDRAQREIRLRKELLDNAQANFQSKKENELYRIEQDNRSLEQYKEALKARERALNDRLQEAIRKTQEEDRVYMAQMVSEWNKKEAELAKRCETVWDRIREISVGQRFSAQEAARLKKLEEEVKQYQKMLSRTERALNDAVERTQKTNAEVEILQKQNEQLSNKRLRDKLERSEASVNSLKKRLKLVEESAAVRINDLKLHHKLATEKLHTISYELRRSRSKELEELEQPRQRRNQLTVSAARLSVQESDSLSTSTPSESSFEQHFRDRMRAIDREKQQMDFSLGKYLLHGRLEPLDMQTFQIPVTKVVDDVEKPAPNNSQEHPNLQFRKEPSSFGPNTSHSNIAETVSGPKSSMAEGAENVERSQEYKAVREQTTSENVEKRNATVDGPVPSDNSKIDPLMLRYMKIIEEQRKNIKEVAEQSPERQDKLELSEEPFTVEAAEKPNTPDTPSDFGW